MANDYSNNWPAIDDLLIERLSELFPLTDKDLQSPEWSRAYLAGQRSVVAKLETIQTQQRSGQKTSQHLRR